MLVLFLLLKITLVGFIVAQKCVSRDYGNDGTVCVCNSTYCDTIQQPEPLSTAQYHLYTSNQAGLRFHQTNGTMKVENYADAQIHVDSSMSYQTIIGWGGAFTDATGININNLPENAQENLLRSYFSEDGIEYTIGRVPIGGTDFSNRAYTYDDGPEDPDLDNFNLTMWDYNYKMPFILRAMNLTNGTLKLFCSAWTAPTWMKTNDQYAGFGFLRRSMYGPWANYYVKFLDAYQEQGISFWGVTTGNEPADVLNPFDILEVVGWPSWLLAEWIANYLGPTIQNSNYSDIKIMMLDDQRLFLPWYVQRVLGNDFAKAFVDGIAVHWYLDEYVPPTVLTQTHFLYPDKFILATEASVMPEAGEPAVLLGSWSRGEKYSYDIIQDMNNWVTGWVDWNLVLNLEGGPNYINNFVDSPVIVNATSGEFYKQPLFYHLGHFSKFIPSGTERIHSEVRGVPNLDVVAFQTPQRTRVVVILNRSRGSRTVRLLDGTRGTASLELTGNSITTMIYY